MTEQEAKDFLIEFDAYLSKCHFEARFKSTSLARNDSALYEKREHAKIVLGKSQWQRSYKQLRTVYPRLPLCTYLKRRIKKD